MNLAERAGTWGRSVLIAWGAGIVVGLVVVTVSGLWGGYKLTDTQVIPAISIVAAFGGIGVGIVMLFNPQVLTKVAAAAALALAFGLAQETGKMATTAVMFVVIMVGLVFLKLGGREVQADDPIEDDDEEEGHEPPRRRRATMSQTIELGGMGSIDARTLWEIAQSDEAPLVLRDSARTNLWLRMQDEAGEKGIRHQLPDWLQPTTDGDEDDDDGPRELDHSVEIRRPPSLLGKVIAGLLQGRR